MTDPVCGRPHYDYPETLCTEPAGHYRRDQNPHAGPLILDGRECGGAAWDEPKEQHVIQPGQTYRSLERDDLTSNGSPRRIRVVGNPGATLGRYGFGKVDIVTLTEDGREIRRRAIETSQLHDSSTTASGQPRRTGYALEQQ